MCCRGLAECSSEVHFHANKFHKQSWIVVRPRVCCAANWFECFFVFVLRSFVVHVFHGRNAFWDCRWSQMVLLEA